MLGRSGILGLLLVVALLYFTSAGSWAWNNIKGLDSGCYSSMSRVSTRMADPVCGAVSKAIAAIDTASTSIGDRLSAFGERIRGTSSFGNLNQLASAFGERVNGLASSSETLSRMVQAGPARFRQSSFQQSVDSFAIGQNFLNMDGHVPEALPWLQQGAAQSQGYGLMSQLALGNLYINGGTGVAANPQMATYYLSQAQNSIGVLSQSRSPQSQQLLQALPASPQQTQAELQRLIRQLSQGGR